MTQVVIGLGSNIQPEQNLFSAVQQLRDVYDDLVISPVYQSAAQGFIGADFWNLVAIFNTATTLSAVAQALRLIEVRHGRPQPSVKFSDRTLDIDILLFGDCIGEHAGRFLPRQDILQYGFVLRPLCDLLPDALHPVRQQTYAALWAEFPTSEHLISPLPSEKQSVFSGFFRRDRV